jgi:putative ABC transport system substrate-binding protein
MITKRRSLVVLGLVGLAGAFGVCAQPHLPLIGVLAHGFEAGSRFRLEALRDGLRELGYVDGKTCRIEVRYSDNQIERLPGLARELLALKPDVVVASPVRAAQALHRETRTVPIVMASGAGAQNFGLIASLARPGGNVTGLTNQGDELTSKHFELLREVAPRAKRVVTLSSGLGAVEGEVRTDSRSVAKGYGMELIEALADAPEKLAALSARCERERCEALVVLLDPNVFNFRKEIVAFAAKLRIPAIYPGVEFAEEGGLAAYSVNGRQLWRRAATYVHKILKGAKPGDLPIEQPTKFELVVNLKTAKALGLSIPQSIRLRADRVIE